MHCLGSRSDKLAGGGRGRSRGRSGTSRAGAGTLVAHLLTVAGASGEPSSLSAQADTALIGPQCPAGHGARPRQAAGGHMLAGGGPCKRKGTMNVCHRAAELVIALS